jgi:hypothetical protein
MDIRRLLAVATAMFVAAQAFASERVASVEQLSGTASATASGTGEARALAVGSDVFMHDRIATGPESKLLLRFIDNSTVGQGEHAELVINTYVFNPDRKEANGAGFKLLKGAFRFVTDQITKLNPEAYEVEANFGTIGIRGCDLAFQISEQRDDVFIVGLTGSEEILIELNEEHRAGRDAASLLVTEAGVLVGISPLEGLTRRTFEPSELDTFIDLVPPKLGEDEAEQPEAEQEEAAGEAPAEETDTGDDVASWTGGEMNEGADEGVGAPGEMPQAETFDASETIDDAVADVPLAPQDEEGVEEAAAERGFGTDGEGGDADLANVDEDTTQDGTGTPPDDGGNQPSPGDYVTTVGDQYVVDSASGADWSWGIWGQDTTTTSPDGKDFVRSKYGVDMNGDYITAEEQLAIATGTTLYNLAGSGPAAAVVTYRNDAIMMQGNALFHVRIGQTVDPVWDGTFSLDGTGASLDFSAQGHVNMDGSVSSEHISAYTLNAFGFTLNPSPNPEDSVVRGSLVGPGTGTDPISGIVVEFLFNHPNAPSVIGAAGADLN